MTDNNNLVDKNRCKYCKSKKTGFLRAEGYLGVEGSWYGCRDCGKVYYRRRYYGRS